MGKKSLTKGKVGEREFANLMNGKRVPASGAMRYQGKNGNDVTLPNGWEAEVKRQAGGMATLYKWVDDPVEKPDVVAFRSDGKGWLVTMKADRFEQLMNLHNEAIEAFKELNASDPDSAKHAAERMAAALKQVERKPYE